MTDLGPTTRVVFKAAGKQYVGRISYDRASDDSHYIVEIDKGSGAVRSVIEKRIVAKSACVKWS